MYFNKSQRISIKIIITIIIVLQICIFFKEKLFHFKEKDIVIEYLEDNIKDTIINLNLPAKEKKIILKKDINKVLKKDLIIIKGIGTKLSKHIINYRNVLGGFVDEKQYNEIYGLNNEIINKIKNEFYIDVNNVKKINVNKTEFKQLLKHPYLNFENVKFIFNEKNKGNIKNIDSLIYSLNLDNDKKKYLKKYLKI